MLLVSGPSGRATGPLCFQSAGSSCTRSVWRIDCQARSATPAVHHPPLMPAAMWAHCCAHFHRRGAASDGSLSSVGAARVVDGPSGRMPCRPRCGAWHHAVTTSTSVAPQRGRREHGRMDAACGVPLATRRSPRAVSDRSPSTSMPSRPLPFQRRCLCSSADARFRDRWTSVAQGIRWPGLQRGKRVRPRAQLAHGTRANGCLQGCLA